MGPLMPIQKPPPIWVVSNPRLKGNEPTEAGLRQLRRICERIVRYGDGWLTCCRAQHPEELVQQLEWIREAADELERGLDGFVVSYQVTMHVGDTEADARRGLGEYIAKYYPELSQSMDLSNWGPVGTPEQITDWLRTFADAGVDHFICRFGAIDQPGQVERFAKEVLPLFAAQEVA
jgi:alkanesulfonate monooxygenase SsuD/methylene tetrahydromethanopterin reductase-like flavin-dependent oxidoreductase (luciferase family)